MPDPVTSRKAELTVPTHWVAVTGTERILLIEDEEMLRSTTQQMLERLGYTVVAAENGEEGLRIAERMDGAFDLLLTDLVMPGLSGRAVADWLAAKWPELPVLYTSGYDDDVMEALGVPAGSVAFLQKPFTPVALGRKIREVLAGAVGSTKATA